MRKQATRKREATQTAARLAAGTVARSDEVEAEEAEEAEDEEAEEAEEAEAPRCQCCAVLRDTESLKAEIVQAARHHLYGARSGGLRALSHGFTGGDRHLETAAARKKEEEQLEGRDENCYYFPALQLFSPAEVALRLRGRELVEPAEAWAHFYPEALSEGTSIMGVPSSDEVERTT